MATATIEVRELPARLSEAVALAEAGTDVVVTEHSKPRAKLVPLPKANGELSEEELAERRRSYDRIVAFQAEMAAKYGVMPDSTELQREDRER